MALRVKPEQIGCGNELLLTSTLIARLKKRAATGNGLELQLSQTQIQNTAQRGNLFSALGALAQPFVKLAGFGPKEIELYGLVQKMTPEQKKLTERYLMGEGVAIVCGPESETFPPRGFLQTCIISKFLPRVFEKCMFALDWLMGVAV